MAEKPILFSTPLVQAILEGRKTQTRRVIKPQPTSNEYIGICTSSTDKKDIGKVGFGEKELVKEYVKLPYKLGDILWVRETWQIHDLNPPAYCMMIKYEADGETNLQVEFKPSRYDKFEKFYHKSGWQPSIYMPREVARIFLKVTDVRVERLQEISGCDVLSEGVDNGKSKG